MTVWGQSTSFEWLDMSKDGIDSMVTCVIQDHHGFLWLGTADGFAKYDGYRTQIFKHDPQDPQTVADNRILTLFEDRAHSIWIGTVYGGVSRYDPSTLSFQHYQNGEDEPDGIAPGAVRTIQQDHEGFIWIGAEKGLARYDPGSDKFERIPILGGSAQVWIWSILEDRDHTIWVGTRGGLLVYDRMSGRLKPFELFEALNDQSVTTLFQDRAGLLWFGAESGLFRYDKHRDEVTHFKHDPTNPYSLSNDAVWDIAEDYEGELWVGTDNGLNRFNKETGRFARLLDNKIAVESLEEGDNPGRSVIYTIWADRSQILWIGTADGLGKFDRSKENFEHYAERRADTDGIGLSNGWVHSVLADRNGLLWVGTADGVNVINRNSGQVTVLGDRIPELDGVGVYAVRQSLNDRIWLGTNGSGLFQINSETLEVVRGDAGPERFPALKKDHIWSLVETADGMLWVGSDNGLKRVDLHDNRITHYLHDPGDSQSLSNNWVYAVYEDRRGFIWVATNGGGLNVFDKQTQKFTRYMRVAGNQNSSGHNRVSSIYEDKNGDLWIGTYGGGINKMNRLTGEFTHYKRPNANPGEATLSIIGDESGNLWAGTNQGLVKFDPLTGAFKVYSERDGLQSDVFNIGASFKSEYGEMFFGGINGLNAFFPRQITDNPVQPDVVITDVQLFNRSLPLKRKDESSPLERIVSETEEIVLSHEQNVIRFDFVALHYADPERNRYSFMLDGLNKDWIPTDAGQRFASYSYLEPGHYTFRVKGANKDQVWSDQEATVRVIINPPPWKTIWAYMFYAFAALGLIGGVIYSEHHKLAKERLINERLRYLDKLKDEFFANTSHELRTPLNGIIGLAESLVDGIAGELPDKARLNLSLIISSGKRLGGLVDDILDFSKIKNDHIELFTAPVDPRSLTDVVFLLSQPLIGDRDIKLLNRIPEGTSTVLADEDRLQQIMHNLVGNAVKFTEQGVVEVTAEETDGQLLIKVKDTGIGIPREKHVRIFESFEQADGSTSRKYGGTGLGLAITKQLVNLHGGQIWLESEVGIGSTFIFTLPISGKAARSEKRESVKLRHVEGGRSNIIYEEDEGAFSTSHQVDPMPDAGHFKILIVDDEPLNRQVLLNHLSMRNYSLIEAADGGEALTKLAQNSDIDLVLLDVMMPGMSGYETCRKIRERYPVHELPVIFLTAKNQEKDVVMGFAAEANDYLTKPFTRSELLLRVKTHLQLLYSNRDLERIVTARTKELKEKNRELGLKNQELESIDRIVKEINREISFEKLLQTMLAQGFTLFPQADKGAVFLWDRKRGYFRIVSSMGYDAEALKQITFTREELISRYTSGDSHIGDGVYIIRNFSGLPAAHKFQNIPQPKSMLAMTVPIDNTPQGFLVLDNFTMTDAFDHSDAHRLNRFREHAVSAVAKVRFLQELREKHQEIIKTQEQLIINEKLASLGTLTAGVAHEINTPVGIGLTSASHLDDRLKEFLSVYQKGRLTQKDLDRFLETCGEATGFMLSNLKKASDLIQSFKQVATDQTSQVKRRFRVREYLDEVLMSLGMELKRWDHKIEISGPQDLELDNFPGYLSQIVTNFVMNSLIHGYDKGARINLRFRYGVENRTFFFDYSDDGRGIGEENRKKIFDPFFTTKRGAGGTGLGLHVVYNLVTQQMGGTISCDSEEGKGVQFHIELPL